MNAMCGDNMGNASVISNSRAGDRYAVLCINLYGQKKKHVKTHVIQYVMASM